MSGARRSYAAEPAPTCQACGKAHGPRPVIVSVQRPLGGGTGPVHYTRILCQGCFELVAPLLQRAGLWPTK